MGANSGRARAHPERPKSAFAFLFIAALSTAQFTLFGFMIAAQRDGAHIIDIGGAQRMRAQRIAFLAIDAHAGTAAAGWRVEMQTTIDDMRAVKRELLGRSFTRVGTLDEAGATPLVRMTEPYLLAAEAIVRDPRDAAAIATIRKVRVPLFEALDRAVHIRAERFRQQHDILFAAVVAALVCLMAVILIAWRMVVAPAEQRTRAAMAAVVESRRQFRSLFQENPEAIAIYDLSGRVQRGNRAAVALIGHSAQRLFGAHFSDHLAPESISGATSAFERAAAGGSAAFESVFVGANGERIDVALSLFPNVVEGRVAGVFGIAKDIRQLKRVESSYDEQADRMAALYEVASSFRSCDDRIGAALVVACARLHTTGAFLTEVFGDRATVRAAIGEPAALHVELSASLDDVRGTAGNDVAEARVIAALAQALWPDDVLTAAVFEACVVSVPVRAGERTYGILSLVAAGPGEASLAIADRDFFGLVSSLVGSALERVEQERKLDALAFFDALTGLPNRTLLYDRLAALVRAARTAQTPFAVHYVDLDRFKQVNDNFGHAIGDRVLQIAADRMRGALRPTDTVARIGGDEFIILQPAAPDRRSAQDVGDRLLAVIAAPFIVDGVAHQLGASIGISLYPDDGRDGETLLRQADDALYRAKHDGRNRLQFVA